MLLFRTTCHPIVNSIEWNESNVRIVPVDLEGPKEICWYVIPLTFTTAHFLLHYVNESVICSMLSVRLEKWNFVPSIGCISIITWVVFTISISTMATYQFCKHKMCSLWRLCRLRSSLLECVALASLDHQMMDCISHISPSHISWSPFPESKSFNFAHWSRHLLVLWLQLTKSVWNSKFSQRTYSGKYLRAWCLPNCIYFSNEQHSASDAFVFYFSIESSRTWELGTLPSISSRCKYYPVPSRRF